jgi:hypothetical protein
MYRQSGRGQVRVHLNSVGIDGRARRRSIAPSGGYGELGTVEQVEPGSAVVDEGGSAVAWQESVGSVASESYRPNGLCRRLRSFRGDLGTVSSVTLGCH